ncbi:hypothetical protein P1X14_05750 [Sphingomonas sp. AOB5]|uniref:hypothetical protein n=1 Tax=Sphingomonas sp. AOB5 TaxID=3034017 RepID=UPI0023F8B478|nr:hypothetical protein [Sphingomonas sp. AOB5]MDF7774744.1 hypothetical protein [Sphingomonas sp. AOB5]
MNAANQALARRCLAGAETDTISFPEAVGLLAAAGFDGYLIDYRRGTATYYHGSGETLDLPAHVSPVAIAAAFDVETIRAAIRDAQMLVAGYTYPGFCDRVRAAGCAGYLVSIPGRRAMYFGRTAETHVELFPGS